jgi:hypothetical protein
VSHLSIPLQQLQFFFFPLSVFYFSWLLQKKVPAYARTSSCALVVIRNAVLTKACLASF